MGEAAQLIRCLGGVLALAMAASAAAQDYATLADLVRAHRPQCPSALDRLERQ